MTLGAQQRQWLSVWGILFQLTGAIILSTGFFISQQDAAGLTVSRLTVGTIEEHVLHPLAQDRLTQSHNAMVGLFFTIAGAGLQVIAAWPLTASAVNRIEQPVRREL
jgi:hypothetical protein